MTRLKLIYLCTYVLGLMAMVSYSKESATFVLDPKLQPSSPELSSLPGDIPRPLAAMRDPYGSVDEFVVDEIIMEIKDEKELALFIKQYNGVLLQDGSLPEPHEGLPQKRIRTIEPSPYRLIRVDLDTVDTSLMQDDAKVLGLKGEYSFSSKNAIKLVAIILRSIIEGYTVFPDIPLETHLQEHPDGMGGFLDPEGGCSSGNFPEVCDSTAQETQANIAWQYLRAIGNNEQPFIAIVDRGFAVDVNGNPQFGIQDLPVIDPAFRYDFSRDSRNISGQNRKTNECQTAAGIFARCWHGTTVALTALAAHNNQYGTAGVASNAQPMLYYTEGWFQAASAIRMAVTSGADVINISMGGSCDSLCRGFGFISGAGPLASAIATAASNDVPVFTSAGNNGQDAFQNNMIPCMYSTPICVGALDLNSLNAAPFSNFGFSVDIWAPGTGVLIAPQPIFNTATGQWTPNNNVGLTSLAAVNGTSFASPFVAGVAANMKAVDSFMTVRDYKNDISSTAGTSSTDTKVTPQGTIDAFEAVLEANFQRATGTLSSPLSGSSWDGTVDLGFSVFPGTTVTQVEYWASYERGSGQGRWQGSIAQGDPTRNFQASWDVSGLPLQNTVRVWAILTGPTGFSSVTPEVDSISINVDSIPPTGHIVLPQSNSIQGVVVPLVATVSDDRSGVNRVEFYIYSASNTLLGSRTAFPQDNFETFWDDGSNGSIISVAARVWDNNNNFQDLAPVTSILLDHNAPQVSMIYPPQAPNSVWINGPATSGIVVRAQADDASGIREVVFRARFWNAAGNYVEEEIGTDSVPNFYGEYSVTWDISQIPDQADRTPPHDLIVLADAIDSVGNIGVGGLGWIEGFDRGAPDVSFLLPATDLTVQGGIQPIEIGAFDSLGVGNRVNHLTVTANYTENGQASPGDHVLADISDADGWSGALDLNVLPDQTVNLTAFVEDDAGNSWSDNRLITIDRTGPTVTVQGHNPDPFHANGTRSMSFSYQLSDWATQVTVLISDAMGQLVSDITVNNVNTDPQVLTWNGIDKFGNLLPAGQYAYDFEVSDAAGNLTSQNGGYFNYIPDAVGPTIKLTVASTYSLSSPNPLEITYDIDEDSYVEIEIFDTTAAMMNYLGPGNQKAGSYIMPWDGQDFSGNKVPANADYRIRIRATDISGNASLEETWVTVTP